MQANQPKGGTEKASTPRYDTIVIRGAKGENVPKKVDGGEVVAWSRGHETAAMDALETFVRDLSHGNYTDCKEVMAFAAEALELAYIRRKTGWGADEQQGSDV